MKYFAVNHHISNNNIPGYCAALFAYKLNERVKRSCVICDARFIPKNGTALTCSDNCSERLDLFRECFAPFKRAVKRLFNPRRLKFCKQCGSRFLETSRHGSLMKFCSDKCCETYWRQKRKTRPGWRLAKRLRQRLYEALKGSRISQSLSAQVGCSYDFLREHLQAQFSKGMAWNNFGAVWHIDHIQPLASFDLSDPQQLAIAGHYTNLRPMFAKANLKKGSKITVPQLSLLM